MIHLWAVSFLIGFAIGSIVAGEFVVPSIFPSSGGGVFGSVASLMALSAALAINIVSAVSKAAKTEG